MYSILLKWVSCLSFFFWSFLSFCLFVFFSFLFRCLSFFIFFFFVLGFSLSFTFSGFLFFFLSILLPVFFLFFAFWPFRPTRLRNGSPAPPRHPRPHSTWTCLVSQYAVRRNNWAFQGMLREYKTGRKWDRKKQKEYSRVPGCFQGDGVHRKARKRRKKHRERVNFVNLNW